MCGEPEGAMNVDAGYLRVPRAFVVKEVTHDCPVGVAGQEAFTRDADAGQRKNTDSVSVSFVAALRNRPVSMPCFNFFVQHMFLGSCPPPPAH